MTADIDKLRAEHQAMRSKDAWEELPNLLDEIETLRRTLAAEIAVRENLDVSTAEHIARTRGWLAPTETEDTLRKRAEIAEAALLDLSTLRPLDTWHDDDSTALFWRVPVNEPPYCGSPLCDDWTEDYYTHWSPLPRNLVGAR